MREGRWQSPHITHRCSQTPEAVASPNSVQHTVPPTSPPSAHLGEGDLGLGHDADDGARLELLALGAQEVDEVGEHRRVIKRSGARDARLGVRLRGRVGGGPCVWGGGCTGACCELLALQEGPGVAAGSAAVAV